MEWSKRENLIPNYNLENLDEEYIDQNFHKIKQNVITTYNLEGLSDVEIEDALFKLFMLQEENFNDDLDKVITLSYINGFQNNLQTDIYTITSKAPAPDSLQANQYLFSIKNRVVKNNCQLVFTTFLKYFCYLKDNNLKNKLNHTEYPNTDSLLLQIVNTKDNLFAVPSKIDPKIAAVHLQAKYNYDHNYWLKYFKTLETKKEQLLTYFKDQEKLDTLEDFEQIANFYYSYATYYKLNNQIKRKTR